MAVPYHTHNFELPAATKQEVVAGIVADKVVVPACLGSAAVEDVAAFATAAQGVKADLAVSGERKITAGNGLQGGGNLHEDRVLSLSETTLASLELASNAASKYIIISPGGGLTGGGSLTERNIELSLNASSLAAIAKAQSAVQPADLGGLAKKNKITISDISATGTANSASFLRGDGSWAVVSAGSGGSGDMQKAVYDPNGKNGDAFNMDNMVAGTTNRLFTVSDKSALDNAAAKTVLIAAGSGLTGGGSLGGQNIELSLNTASLNAISKAQTAVQPADLGALAKKSKIDISDISATGTADSNRFLRGDGSWAIVSSGAGGSGDMQKAVYDPSNIAKDMFNADNIIEGNANLFLKTTERRAIASILSAQNSFVGQIAFFAATTAPSGWLKANGALVSRASFPNLWTFAVENGALVTDSEWNANGHGCFSYGTGDASMFRIPDLRGEFLRGFDDARGIDNNRAIGSWQSDAIRNISGLIALGSWCYLNRGTGAIATTNQVGDGGVYGTGSATYRSSLSFEASRVVPTATENRPRNIALLACIRY